MDVTGGKPMARGRTRWRRFGLAFIPAFGSIATVLVLMATGVIALPIAISGAQFTVSAASLTEHAGPSPGFIQFGEVDSTTGNPADCVAHPSDCTAVAVTDITNGADLGGPFTQTVCGPTGLVVPAVANLKLVITADDANATGGLIVDTTSLSAPSPTVTTFQNIQVGVPETNREGGSTFGQTADSININGPLTQGAVYTQAGTFALKGLNLSVSFVSSC